MKYAYIILSFFLLGNTNSEKDIKSYIHDAGIKYPKIVYAQAIIETGWFQCEGCSMDHNNIFGFRTKDGYIKFDSWKESVDYYKKWQDKHYTKGRNYYDFLNCIYTSNSGRCIRYAQDSLYTNKIKYIVNGM